MSSRKNKKNITSDPISDPKIDERLIKIFDLLYKTIKKGSFIELIFLQDHIYINNRSKKLFGDIDKFTFITKKENNIIEKFINRNDNQLMKQFNSYKTMVKIHIDICDVNEFYRYITNSFRISAIFVIRKQNNHNIIERYIDETYEIFYIQTDYFHKKKLRCDNLYIISNNFCEFKDTKGISCLILYNVKLCKIHSNNLRYLKAFNSTIKLYKEMESTICQFYSDTKCNIEKISVASTIEFHYYERKIDISEIDNRLFTLSFFRCRKIFSSKEKQIEILIFLNSIKTIDIRNINTYKRGRILIQTGCKNILYKPFKINIDFTPSSIQANNRFVCVNIIYFKKSGHHKIYIEDGKNTLKYKYFSEDIVSNSEIRNKLKLLIPYF